MKRVVIENGQTGNKQGKGFYRSSDQGDREVLDLNDESYGPAPRLLLPLAEKAEKHGVKHLLADDGRYGQFAWRVLSRSLSYAASLIPEVGDDPLAIDDAMKLGYNWIKGPFELIDEIGVDYLLERLNAEAQPIPDFLAEAAGSSFYRLELGELQSRHIGGRWQSVNAPKASSVLARKGKPSNPAIAVPWLAGTTWMALPWSSSTARPTHSTLILWRYSTTLCGR